MKNKKEKYEIHDSRKMTRQEALRRGGKYAVLTAAAMFTVLSPKESQATSTSSSPAPPTGW